MTDKVAKEDIIQKNAYGQNVVVVPAGQPIPEDLPDAPAVPIAQADESDTSDAPAPKKSAAKKK